MPETSSPVAKIFEAAPTQTLLEARTRFFEAYGFGADGGYADRWVELAIGPMRVALPNTPSRVKAVRYHDLHHVVTGYQTDLRGEAEISAWELGAGCKDMAAAWVLNLAALGLGAVLAPRRVYRAFIRGRRSSTLYGRPYEPLLGQTVAEARRGAGLEAADADRRPASLGQRALFAATVVAGAAATMVTTVIAVVVFPFGLAGLAAKRRAQQRDAGDVRA